jgi:glycosyltransferase involved in cell wall biosynthesis
LDWLDWWGHGGTIVERSGNIADRLFSPVETFFEEHFRTRADGSLTISSALRRRVLALGVPASSVVTIPFGADIDSMKPRPQLEARLAIGLEPCRPTIGYVGAILRRDAQMLSESIEFLLNRVAHLQLLVIGNPNIPVPPHLLRSGAVKVTGWLEYKDQRHILQAYISACDLMLLPMKNSIANQGRWPSKVCDYLASGRAVVATRVGDAAALIERADCGILTGDTPEQFADGIQAALGNKAALERMGANARNVATDELDWSLLTDQLERFYQDALASKAGALRCCDREAPISRI